MVPGQIFRALVTESFTNRLIKEKSPYLRQHAHNPIDWYAWGNEAFESAKKLDRPIFLSIGYATCHWCHVMEREAFSDEAVGKFLSEHFISVKVDREEHPEVDSLYMDFAQAIMGSGGGWPLNLILSPDLKPLLAATYLPLTPMRGLPSFMEFITQVKALWEGLEREELLVQSAKLVEAFAQSANAAGVQIPTDSHLQEAVSQLFNLVDPIHGGLKGESKFPLGFQAEFLLLWSRLKGDSRALYYDTLTLDNMHRGGIYDHLGGGFARYAVDEEWTIPHFEKMLYDNAILTRTYLQAFRATGISLYQTIAKETAEYMIRDLMRPEGGFYGGEDAETNGQEGLFYTWTPEEVQAVIQGDDGDLFCAFYDVTTLGNFEGRNVLHIDLPLDDFARAAQLSKEEVETALLSTRKRLFEQRLKRKRPLRDEIILTGWNGLVVDALALAGSVLQEPRYTQAAIQTVEFIKKEMWKEGRLLHRWCDGESRFEGLLEDYAFLIKGLLTLYECGYGMSYLTWSLQLADILERDFKDIEGAFYKTSDTNTLFIRSCDFYDGAEPSGNGVHAENLLRLYAITGEDHFIQQAEDILKASLAVIQQMAPAALYHSMALLRYLDKTAPTLRVALGSQGIQKEELQKMIFSKFIPHLTVVWKEQEERLGDPMIQPVEDHTAVYLCQHHRCESPLTKYEQIVHVIEKL